MSRHISPEQQSEKSGSPKKDPLEEQYHLEYPGKPSGHDDVAVVLAQASNSIPFLRVLLQPRHLQLYRGSSVLKRRSSHSHSTLPSISSKQSFLAVCLEQANHISPFSSLAQQVLESVGQFASWCSAWHLACSSGRTLSSSMGLSHNTSTTSWFLNSVSSHCHIVVSVMQYWKLSIHE